MSEKYASQIYRVDSKDSSGNNIFMEVLNTAFPIGKVQINFAKNDAKTNKQLLKLELYLDIKRALYLINIMDTGKLDVMIAEAKKSGWFEKQKVSNYTSYFTDMGGINLHKNDGKLDKEKYEKVKKQFAWAREDKEISRQLKIQESTKYKYMFRAEYNLGHLEEGGTGLIVPDDYKGIDVLQIPLSNEDVIAFCEALRIHLNAYYNQYYNKFSNDLFYKQTCNVFKPNSK